MPKHRKTKKEKLRASMRQQTVSVTVSQPSSEVSSVPSTKTPEKFSLQLGLSHQSGRLIISHDYLTKELFKTALLSAAIIICELFLFLLLRNHAIVLLNLSY